MLHQFLRNALEGKLRLEGKQFLLWQQQQQRVRQITLFKFRKQFGSIWDTISSKFHHKSSWQKMQHLDIPLIPYYYQVLCSSFGNRTIPQSTTINPLLLKVYCNCNPVNLLLLEICYYVNLQFQSTKQDHSVLKKFWVRRASLFKMMIWVWFSLDCCTPLSEFQHKSTWQKAE